MTYLTGITDEIFIISQHLKMLAFVAFELL